MIMRDSYLLLTPVLVLGVLGLVRFVGCDLVFGVIELPPAPLEFATVGTLGMSRNDFTGFAGMAIDVGSKALKVQSLERYCVANSTGDHRIKIVDAETGMQVGDTALVSLANKSEGFVSAKLMSATTLTAGKRYYIVSEELTGGDFFFDNDTTLTILHPDATVVQPVYFNDPMQQWVLLGTGQSYGPVNFAYTK
jgi:hypothetical protein